MDIGYKGRGVFLRWQRLSLAHKVAASIFLSLIPLVLLAVGVSNAATAVLRTEMQQNVGLNASVGSARVERSISRASQVLFEITVDPSFGQTSELDEYLSETLTRWSADGVVGLAVYDDSRNLLAQAGSLSDGSIELATGTSSSLGSIFGDAFLVETSPRLPVARLVYPGGRSQPSIMVVSEWDIPLLLGSSVNSAGQDREITETLLAPTPDGSYLVLDSPLVASVGSRVEFDISEFVAIGEDDDVLTSDKLTDNGVAVLAGVSTVDRAGWSLLATVPKSEAFADIQKARLYILAVFICAGLMLIVIGTIVFRSFARRLLRITTLAEAIAAGDLTVRTGDKSSDALGNLSSTFDLMAAALAQDKARRERVEAELAFQATHDALTGLPNRSQLVSDLDRLLTSSESDLSVLFVDLDGFKQVNDRLGHAAGDELLKRVASRLREVTRPGDLVVRLGGDEFVIVLNGLGVFEAEATASRIVSVLELPYVVGGDEASISASIGVAEAGELRESEAILREADVAMYRAKAMGKGRAMHLGTDASRALADQGLLLTELREAISDNELEMRVRPLGDLRDKSLLGVELVPAWNHPERGLLRPEDLDSLVEHAGFATQLDDWTIRSAIRIYCQWRDKGVAVDTLAVSINISAQTFESPKTVQLLENELVTNQIKPANFNLQVAEGVLRGDPTTLRICFNSYRALGIGVALTDFGTDLTSAYSAPVHAIESAKIDLGRLHDVSSGSPTSRALVESLVNLANSSGLRATLAGVDNDYLRDLALSLQCNLGQGDWYSGELSEDQFIAFADAQNLLASS